MTIRSIRQIVALSAVLGLVAASRAPAQEERSLTTPTDWAWYYGKSFGELTAILISTHSRPIDLEVETTSPVTFAFASVENSGKYAADWWMFFGLTLPEVTQTCNQYNARIIDLEPYEEDGSTRYAVVMVDNSGPDSKTWWWHVSTDFHDVVDYASNHDARIIDIDTWVVSGIRLWSGVMIHNAGADASAWWWFTGYSSDDLAQAIEDKQARVINLEHYTENGENRYAAIAVPNTGSDSKAWWWWFRGSEAEINSLAHQGGARVIDIEPYFVTTGFPPKLERRFSAVLLQNSNALTRQLAGIMEYGSDGATGFLVKEVGESALASLNSRFVYEPASSLKVLVLTHTLLQVQEGHASLGEMIPWCSVSSNAQSPKDGCPNAPCGETIKLFNACKQMMQVSDNRATDALVRRFGMAAINATADDLGMTLTDYNHRIGCGTPPNELSLVDITHLYELVSTGLLDDDRTADFFTAILTSWSSDLQDVVDQEGAALGLSASERADFVAKCRYARKGGSYGVWSDEAGQFLTYLSAGGSLRLPFCSNGRTELHDFTFGYFVHGAKDADHASERMSALGPELLREPIRAALATFAAPCEPPAPKYVLGDANLDRKVDLSDAVAILGVLFLGKGSLRCEDAADTNDDGRLDISDASSLLNFLFLGGRLPLPRGVEAGELQTDPTLDQLDCDFYPSRVAL